MELNRDQIIKALECCGRSGITPSDVKCSECPYHNNCSFGRTLLLDALSLIKEQEDQIFKLENRLKECENGYGGTLFLDRCKLHDAEEKINELTEENKAWQQRMIAEKEQADKAYYDLACEVEDLRAENERLRADKKRGYWFTDYARQPMVVCSNCNLSNNSNRSKYCPHCGARMDGK